jgi:hypothetical protein
VGTTLPLGTFALSGNTTASNNTAVGYQAGYSNTTGTVNTFIGMNAGYSNTASGNVFLGAYVGYYNTSGVANAALGGAFVGTTNTTFQANTTGSYNTVLGAAALQSNTTASNNTAVGYQAGYSNQTGLYNTFVGSNAGYNSNKNGNGLNTFIGNGSGSAVTTGSNHTIIGAYDGYAGGALDIRTANNYIVLSDGAGNPRGIFDGSGNFLVGRTSVIATEKFNVTSASTEVAFFQNSSNTSGYSGIRSQIGSSNTSTWHFRGETRGYTNYYLYGNGTTSYSSDIRLKKNVQTARGYLEDLNKLRVVKYQWKGEDPDCQQVELGLIAQEVEEVFPNLIQEHEVEGVGNMKHIKQSVLPFMMLKAIQEQQAIIESLTARVSALEGN